MTVSRLRKFLKRDPFKPFHLRLSSGDSYVIRNPDLVVIMRSEVFIAIPDADRWTVIPLLHIAAAQRQSALVVGA